MCSFIFWRCCCNLFCTVLSRLCKQPIWVWSRIHNGIWAPVNRGLQGSIRPGAQKGKKVNTFVGWTYIGDCLTPKRLPWKSKSTIFWGFLLQRSLLLVRLYHQFQYSFNVFWYAGLVNNVYIWYSIYILYIIFIYISLLGELRSHRFSCIFLLNEERFRT